MRELLDFGDQGRDRAIVKMQKYKQTMVKLYNRRVKNRQFVAGDLVLRMFKASKAKDKNKLNPKWEGPKRVKKVVGPETYILEELLGKEIEHTWHETPHHVLRLAKAEVEIFNLCLKYAYLLLQPLSFTLINLRGLSSVG
ncbi:hypothetical protein LIER_28509 [Lithospermum erythrorhizon]|uniref:Uncharacterized protein n=1 Tax=Lithospermum erythrorhizon TaxID=34254 RepID=A0AAV3RLY0_LITER